jgi:hypothetical protein
MKKLALALLIALASSQAPAQYAPDFRNSTNSPHIYAPNGEYLGNLNRNQFDPNSVSNQFGAGSQFRSNGVNNPFSPNYTPGLAPRRCYGLGC